MGLKEDLETKFEPFAEEMSHLDETWSKLSEENLSVVLGKVIGASYKAIGMLADAVLEIAEHIDFLESGKG